MPVVDVDPDELRRLTGHEEKDDEALKDDLFALGLEYEGDTEDGKLQLEFGPDRLDRLSVEGVARSLRYQYGDDRGVYVPNTNDADWVIDVDESVPEERPYVTGAVIRGVDLDEEALDSLIQLQEKLHATMGRKRAKGAIGIHDLTMLKGEVYSPDDDASGRKSVTYRGIDPDGDRFVPLDSDAAMTPAEVLTDHPTGETYAPIVREYDRYPAIYDEIGLFSFPPVINGSRTEVDTDSRDLFVELTGTDQWTIDRMCNVICYALDARGATVEEVDVAYPDGTVVRPDFECDEKTVAHDRIEGILGVDLDADEVVDLFERSGLEAAVGDEGVAYEVSIPPYRTDVLHPLDLVDDVGRAYGFNELDPRYPDVATVGARHDRSNHERAARTTLVGLGFEDLLNFHMISGVENLGRMTARNPDVSDAVVDAVDVDPDTAAFVREEGLAASEVLRMADRAGGHESAHDLFFAALNEVYDYDVEGAVGFTRPATIAEPYSEDYTMVRTWALPSLLMVLENNTHRAYPQDLADIGLAAAYDESEDTHVAEHRTVAGVLARHDATYEDAKSRLAALCADFDADLETPATDHPTFIDGRAAEVVIDGESVGVIGEVHPRVLVEHDLELPVAAFELRLDALA